MKKIKVMEGEVKDFTSSREILNCALNAEITKY